MNDTKSDVVKAPHQQDNDLRLWLLIGCCVGGTLLLLTIAAIICIRKRSQKFPDKQYSWFKLAPPQETVWSFSSQPYKSNNFRRPLGPSASLDPPSILDNTVQECVQPRPILPRWHTFPSPQTSAVQLNTRNSDEGLQPCPHGRIWFSISYKDQKLEVVLHKAKYLPGRGLNNIPRDPFVKVYLLPDESIFHQSKVQKRTLSPNFNETFTFDVSSTDLPKRTLKFSMYDVDKRRVRHCLGHALQSLDLLQSMGSCRFYKDLEMAPQPVAPLGDVQLSLCCNPFSNRIKVTICRIRLLEHHPAVFVRVELFHGRRVVKTKRTRAVKCQGCEEQVVDESFGFAVSGRFFDSCSLAIVVIVEGGAPLGKVVVGPFMYARGDPLHHWQEMLSNPRSSITKWHILADCDDTKDSDIEKQ